MCYSQLASFKNKITQGAKTSTQRIAGSCVRQSQTVQLCSVRLETSRNYYTPLLVTQYHDAVQTETNTESLYKNKDENETNLA